MKVEWIRGDGYYRPALFVTCLGRMLGVFFGWQKPSFIWWAVK